MLNILGLFIDITGNSSRRGMKMRGIGRLIIKEEIIVFQHLQMFGL